MERRLIVPNIEHLGLDDLCNEQSNEAESERMQHMSMGMDTTRRVIALYIHPDSGPVMPMEIDLMEVEIAALKVPGSVQRDNARVNEIARRIKAQFPGIDTSRATQEIAALIGKLGHYAYFNGVVLRLPGSIDLPSTAAKPAVTPDLKEIKEQVSRFTQEIAQLKKAVQIERQEHLATKGSLYTVEGENKRLKAQSEKSSTELADARLHIQRLQERFERARDIVNTARTATDTAEQEAASVKTELEQAQSTITELKAAIVQMQQESSGTMRELSSLRQQALHDQKAEEQLRATLEDYKSEISSLRDKLRRMVEGDDGEGDEVAGEYDPFAML